MVEENSTPATRVQLIESDDAEPRVRLVPGKRYDVVATTVVDQDMQQVPEDARRPARLCGSRSTCLAIVEVE
jgi:hypothetical protein